MVLTVFALPMLGQDYLTIFLKDGKTERHLLSLVKKITTSKVDLNGVTHSDYQVQQVWMDDTIYTHSFEDIDSVSFRKVNEEQVVQDVESVSSTLEGILRDCDSFDEIKSYSEQIRNNPGVEDVVVNDNSVVVRIKDWRDIVILSSYKNGVDMSEYNIKRQQSSRILKMRKSYPINQSLRVAIADQNAKNESEAYVLSTNALKEIQTTFEGMGYEVDYIPQPDLTFFRQNIFNYDLILLTTHGLFDGSLHWFATGEEIGNHGFFWGLSRTTTQAWFNSNNDLEDAKFCFIKEKRSGEQRWVLYTVCSEDYIRKSPFKFENKNPIIFTNVCESLNGNNSVAEMFIKKGASIYLGYKGSTYLGEYATDEFFCDWMLNGTSAQFAYENLEDIYKKESETIYEGAVLKIIPEENNSSFIVNTITAPSSEVKDEIWDDGEHVYTVYGYTTMNVDLGIIKGFQLSYNPNMEDCEDTMCTSETYLPNNGKGNYRFQVSFKPHNTFYYRAYTYDGLHYNYGEVCEYTLEKPKDLKLSSGSFCINEGKSTTIDITSGNGEYDISNSNDKAIFVTLDGEIIKIDAIGAGESTIIVTDKKTGKEVKIEVTVWANLSIAIIGNIDLEVGASADVRIMSGNGDYKLESSDPDVATPSLVGEFVKVDALSAGTATITVTDNKTGQTESFTVTIAEPAPIDIPAEPINLGLPSGTLWASWNVGATAPEEYGNYYSWGETEVRDQYYFTTYSLCDGTVSSCHDIGADISGTQYDVAHVKWGGGWCMPSKDDFMELVYNCEYKETTQNGVKGLQFTGKNGNYIFLPYTGYYWNTENSKVGSEGSYWSSTLTTSRNHAHEMSFSKGEMLWDCYINRFAGLSVRPVKHSAPTYDNLVLSTYDPINMIVNGGATFMILSGSGSYAVESSDKTVASVKLRDNYVDVLGEAAGTATITVSDTKSGEKKTIEVTITDNTPSPGTHAEAVDLGLPSGTKWADRNVGASSPEDYGGLYSWAMTEEVEAYSRYKWGHGEYGEITKYCTDSKYGTVDNKTILDPEDDAAYVAWGGQWLMPTLEQAKELVANCDSEWTTLNGVWGRRYTSKINGNAIFFPAAGYFAYETYYSKGTNGFYWTSTLNDKNSERAYDLFLASGSTGTSANFRYYGASVRPVKK